MTADKDLTQFYKGREGLATRRTQEVRDKAQQALADLLQAGEPIDVATVARAAGIGRTTLHGDAYKDIYDNIKQAMGEQPLPGSPRTTRATTERGYQAQLMDLHQQLTEAREQIEELKKRAGSSALIAAAAPTGTDLDNRDIELAHLRAELINHTEQLAAAKNEAAELRSQSGDKQERIDKLIRDNTELVQEKAELNRHLKTARRELGN